MTYSITWSQDQDPDVFGPEVFAEFPGDIICMHAEDDWLFVLIADGRWYKMRLP